VSSWIAFACSSNAAVVAPIVWGERSRAPWSFTSACSDSWYAAIESVANFTAATAAIPSPTFATEPSALIPEPVVAVVFWTPAIPAWNCVVFARTITTRSAIVGTIPPSPTP
jgi:hypothetical protein